jgi:hypothetical protein
MAALNEQAERIESIIQQSSTKFKEIKVNLFG